MAGEGKEREKMKMEMRMKIYMQSTPNFYSKMGWLKVSK